VGANDPTILTKLPVPTNGVAATDEALTPRRGGWLLVVVGALLIALLLGLAAFMLFRFDGSGGTASPSASASVGASPSGTVSASPTRTVDPFYDARAASDEMRAAIAAARGPDGLNGREARDLESLLDQFDRALDNDDPKTARDEANKLAGQVAELIDQGAVDAQGAARLRTAADGLVAAANALPD
jgi:hypothetical protein